MSEFIDVLIARVLQLEVNLLAGRERMAAATDDEALHDVRIAVRKLRSLLRPFRKMIEHDPLVNAAAALGPQQQPGARQRSAAGRTASPSRYGSGGRASGTRTARAVPAATAQRRGLALATRVGPVAVVFVKLCMLKRLKT